LVAPTKSVIETSFNQSLRDSASRKLSINPQHIKVQELAGRNCPPSTELLIECLQHGENGQEFLADLVQVQSWRGSEIIGEQYAGQLSRVPAPRDKRKSVSNGSGRKALKELLQVPEGKAYRNGGRFRLAERGGEQSSDFLRIERRSYVIVDGFLGQHVR
jgi:hypothetical protein